VPQPPEKAKNDRCRKQARRSVTARRASHDHARSSRGVGLLGVLSAKQMGAERIIAMSRREAR